MTFTRFKTTYYAPPAGGRLAILTMDNGADHRKPNTLGQEALASLSDALDEVGAQTDLRGLMLVGKPFIFAAGADLGQFGGVDEDFARRAARAGQDVFRRLAELPFPTLAAINGVCLGGGLELALHCDYRTISDAARPVGFPEVFLSILPAWGGTQLVPRLLGARRALELIVANPLDNNRTLSARQADEFGLADRIFPNVDFVEASRELLEALATGEERIERSVPGDDDLDTALAEARARADARVRGATPAPYRAIDLVEFAARGGDLDEGYRRERDALAELLPARQAQASVYSFDLTNRRVRRQPWRPAAAPREVNKVAIVGAGLMGAQLGALFLRRLEVPVVMKDIDAGVLDSARGHIEAAIDRQVARGRLTEAKAGFLKSIVVYTLDNHALEGSDVVVEAVVERVDVKKRVLADVEAVVDEGAVLASNTSSLSVGEMAADLAHPGRVIGLHFFNPVEVMPLLEVVRTDAATDEAVATGFELSKRLRKSGVECRDTPAFIVNRLLMAFNGACFAALRHGNSFREIDEAIRGLGLPMGPFELLSFVGLKVAYHTAETLQAAFPDRFPPDDNFRRIADLDVDGVYGPDGEPHDAVLAAVETDPDADALSPDQIRQSALEVTAEEAKVMLDQGVVADARDLDTGLLLGAGWPFFVGGICFYADRTGLSDKLFGHRLVGAEDRAGG